LALMNRLFRLWITERHGRKLARQNRVHIKHEPILASLPVQNKVEEPSAGVADFVLERCVVVIRCEVSEGGAVRIALGAEPAGWRCQRVGVIARESAEVQCT